ncbi:MAG: septal ring lytic transglycosylase RlpA family protein [Acidobacteria bacterium]|nr:septal ring lytic transglycosylase RlpA family protein [Acidobacteriota bacterium]
MHFEPINMGLPRTSSEIAALARALSSLRTRSKKYFARDTRSSSHRASSPVRAPHLIALLIVLSSLSACGTRRAPARVPVARIGSTEEGIASWYGEPYHGRRAANGEIFDMEKFTAAHPALPFETWVRVRRLDTKSETEVRIVDRGPFVKGRIIDLSRAAARDIDLIRSGTAKVRITVIPPPKDYLRGKHFAVQVSSLSAKPRAESLQRQLTPDFKDVEIRYRSANPKGGHAAAWRVLVGRESTPAAAQRILERLREKFPNAFIVPWDAE